MTRAVIKLSGYISPVMPLLSRRIAGCSFHPEAHLLAFRLKNMTATIDPRRINLQNVEDEAAVQDFMAWLINLTEESA